MINKEEILQLWEEEDGCRGGGSFILVEDGDWIDDGKYSYKETVVKYGDTYLSFCDNRSGSYYTDYYYGDTEVYEVEPVEVTTTVYKVKK